MKCFVSNFPIQIPNFGPEQIDSIQYHFQATMLSPTKKQIHSKLLLDTNSEFTLFVEVNKKEVLKNLGNTGYQKHIFTSMSKYNSAHLDPLREQILSLSLIMDSEGEKPECVSKIYSQLLDDSLFDFVL